MIQLNQFVDIVGNSLFNGDTSLAGIIIFCAVMGLIFAWNRKPFTSMLLMIPVAFVFTSLGIIGGDFMIILILVAVLGLATTAKGAMTRGD